MKKRLIFPFVLFLLILLTFSGCGKKEAHVHAYSEWEECEAPTCTEEGLKERCCSCGEVQTATVPIVGHTYGSWIVDTPERQYRVCGRCSYREIQFVKSDGEASTTIGDYGTFDLFLADCTAVGNHRMQYSGKQNLLEVSLLGQQSCNEFTLCIPSKVTYVKFTGAEQGNPLQNVKFVFEERAQNIEIVFENVDIESTDTIFESFSRNINVNIEFKGAKCRFEVVGKRADGANGVNKHMSGLNVVNPTNGEKGEDGKHAFISNGYCTLNCSANEVLIRGGNGGNGGIGGSCYEKMMFGDGANGGNGGNGGNGFAGEAPATVKITTPYCSVNIVGGSGGDGGREGYCQGFGVHNGASGQNGKDGVSGCKEYIYIYEN